MSTYPVTTYVLYCNGRVAFGDTTIGCYRRFEVPGRTGDLEGSEDGPRPAQMRKLAAAQGWTHIRSPHGRRFDEDFCPDHKPEGDNR